jgi:hypothetical protein
VLPEGLGKLKKLIRLIGSGTRDLPACSIEPSLYFSIELFQNRIKCDHTVYRHKYVMCLGSMDCSCRNLYNEELHNW